ncbi:MAG: poly-gamma-glutamate synthase PgsB, partial [Clostridium sp.]|nr:poly-gamma-glutamate synthase PgsB [Clostridium sp.]
LKEAGYKVIGKTTGSAARMIYWDSDVDEIIYRRPEGPNISEQKSVAHKAAKKGADALVSECMAVNPDYQKALQEELVKANLVVIVNVLEDHMDVMGPTLDQIAEGFTNTIPYNGQLIIAQNEYVNYFKRVARRRKTKVYVAEDHLISEAYLRRFNYMVFPQNASLALAVSDALGIDRQTAFRGMLKAHPDPGAAEVLSIPSFGQGVFFINGFAVNDATSTLSMLDRINALGYNTNNATIIMNCRPDRVDRSIQFAEDVLPHMDVKKIIAMGQITQPVVDAYKRGDFMASEFINMEDMPVAEIMKELKRQEPNSVIFSVGNIHGDGEPLLEALEEVSEHTNLYRGQEQFSPHRRQNISRNLQEDL